jgi:hypothetical protein
MNNKYIMNGHYKSDALSYHFIEFQSFQFSQLQYNEKKPTLYVYINQDAFNLLINQEK